MKNLILSSLAIMILSIFPTNEINAQCAAGPVCVPAGNQAAFYYSPLPNYRLQFNDNAGVQEYQFTNGSGNKVFGVGAVSGNISLGSIGALQVRADRFAFQFEANGNAGLKFASGAPNQYQFSSLTGDNVFTIDEDDGELTTRGGMRSYGKIRAILPSGPGFKRAIVIRDTTNDQGFGMNFINSTNNWYVGPNIGNWNDGRFCLTEASDFSFETFIFTPDGKLGLMNINQTPAYRFHISQGNSTTYAAYIDGENQSTTSASGSGIFTRGGIIGLHAEANNRDIDGTWYNVYGYQFTGTGDNSGNGYGVYGYASGSRAAGNSLYGIYGLGAGTLGSGTAAYAGYFAGNVTVTGTLSNPSDKKLKENIKPIKSSLNIIDELQPRTYNYKNEAFPHMHLPNQQQYGFVAQDLQKVLPELVKVNMHPESNPPEGSDENPGPNVEYLGVDITALIPILTQGVKDLKEIVEDQNDLIEKQNERIRNLESLLLNEDESHNDNANPKEIKFFMGQNQPNPTSGNTVIPYFIDEGNSADITVNEVSSGKEIMRFNQLNGSGKIEIDLRSLSSGNYVYCLWVNGAKHDERVIVKN